MKRKNVINVLISIIIVAILTFAFVSCDVNNGKEDSLSTTKVVVVPVIEDVTDEAGEPVTDAEGEKVTEVVGTTAVVVDEDEEAPSFVQKPKPTKPNKPTTEKETEESTTKAPETTKTQSSGSSGNSGNGGGSSSGGNTYKPTEAPKPTSKPTEAPIKAPETTKKQETKPATTEKVEPENEYVAELPTHPNGSINMDAMNEASKEENGGTVYF